MKKILVTGVTGFAGSFLAEHLLSQPSDQQIFGTYLSESGLKNVQHLQDSLTLTRVDLTDFESVKKLIEEVKPDEIYHLAAFPSPAKSFHDPAAFLQNNINGELYILESLKQLNMKDTKVLVISSSEVYGAVSAEDLPIDELTPLRPVSPYGVSKIAQDYLGLQYFLAYGLHVVRVRPFGHIGPRLSPDFAPSIFAKKIAEIEKGTREPVLTVGNLDGKRDLTDVRDIVRAYVLLLDKGNKGEVYNLGSGISYKIEDILHKLLENSSAVVTITQDPELLRPNDIPELRCNNKKITELTGWNPEISIDQSLEDLLQYWREQV
jgi:GDP-4-dehydro-6-deoxy-D-mannose reductase